LAYTVRMNAPLPVSEPVNYAQCIAQWEGYQSRPIQQRMMQAIHLALTEKQHILVEAGTGAGKSIGYLLPTVLHAPRPIVVSTGSIALQEQLLTKDIPELSERLYGDATALNAQLVKGRQNYLCIRKLEEVEEGLGPLHPRENTQTQQQRLHIQQLRNAMYEGWEGDKALLEHEIPARLWREMASDAEDCLGWRCRFFDQNPYRLAREGIEQADIIVTNHALYCQDVLSGGGLLPPHELVIFDEAHSLHGYALNAFSARIGRYRSQQLLGRIHKRLIPLPERLIFSLKDIEAQLMHWLFQQAPPQRHTLRLYPNPNLAYFAQQMQDGLYEVLQWVKALDVLTLPNSSESPRKQQQLETEHAKIQEQLIALVDAWGYFAMESDTPGSLDGVAPRVNWAELDAERMSFQLVSTPLDVSTLLREHIWAQRQAILTSATLAVNHRLVYARNQLGLEGLTHDAEGTCIDIEACELVLPAAFQHETQTLGFIPLPNDVPEMPSEAGYWPALFTCMSELLERSQGRAFILFTSHAAMQKVGLELSLRVPFPIRMQGDFPRSKLLEWFRETPNPVLLGTYTFWEGIDMPGDQLSLVMIDRIPFTAPDDPIHQATIERMKQRGEDWFQGYALPQAIIRLKQGVGRLIRRAEDRGVVALLDSRIRSKGYGRRILASLPKMPITASFADVQDFFKTDV
jgi:Rad3-related DNA helicase